MVYVVELDNIAVMSCIVLSQNKPLSLNIFKDLCAIKVLQLLLCHAVRSLFNNCKPLAEFLLKQ